MPKLTLISHDLCPYVQRAVIALTEKGVPFDRVFIDLADKPQGRPQQHHEGRYGRDQQCGG